jgi:NADPH:quinone reductase
MNRNSHVRLKFVCAGLLLTQIASSRGVNVIGTTSTEQKAQIAKENGAKEMIIYTKEDTVARVLEITGGEGVHAVFDGVGKDTSAFLLLLAVHLDI